MGWQVDAFVTHELVAIYDKEFWEEINFCFVHQCGNSYLLSIIFEIRMSHFVPFFPVCTHTHKKKVKRKKERMKEKKLSYHYLDVL